MINKGMRLTALLAVLVCLGCSDSNRAKPDYDLTGTWEAVNAECMSDLPMEVLRHLGEPATWELEIEGTVRFIQTGDSLQIFDFEAEEEAPFTGMVTGDRLEYALSQDDLLIEGEGVIVSPDRLAIDHTFAFPAAGGSVSCQFDAVRL